MERFCRGCLSCFDDPNELLQYTEKNRRQFVYSTGLQIKKDDVFPLQLCKDCVISMQTSCKFKKRCKISDKMFKYYMTVKETGDNVDFYTFILNNETSNGFRNYLELCNTNMENKNGPEDFNDNASDCTSMLNFVHDLLEEDDIVNTEEKLIREIVQDEDNTLDDTIDSHWLRDDVSIDTNFQLPFSFDSIRSPDIQDAPSGKFNAATTKKKLAADDTKEIDELLNSHCNDTNKCTIDSNLEKALNRNKNTCFVEDLILTPTEYRDSSTPIHSNIYADPDKISHKYVDSILMENKGKDIVKGANKSPIKKIGKGCGKKNFDMLKKFVSKVENDEERSSDDSESSDTSQDPKEALGCKGDVQMEEHLNENEPSKDEKPTEILDQIDSSKLPTEIYTHIHKQVLQCKRCDEILETRYKLIKHYRKKHNTEILLKVKYPAKTVTCEVCGKVFSHPSNLKVHMKIHKKKEEGPGTCAICNLHFKTKWLLSRHLEAHNVKKSSQEKQRDSEIYKFVCTECGYRTSSKSNLNVHAKRHNKEFKFSCDVCSKQFYRNVDLRTHLRIHSGERPFKCPHCPSSYTRTDHLTNHLRNHTGERQYICEVCKASFIQLSHLKYHRNKSCTGLPT